MPVWSQHRLFVQSADSSLLSKNISLPDTVASMQAGWQKIQEVIKDWQQQGYLEAEISAYSHTDSVSKYVLNRGKQYRWASLRATALSTQQLNLAGFRRQDFEGKPFQYKKIATILEKLVEAQENNGYPFAKARLDSIQFEQEQVKATLLLDTGPEITFDSLQIADSVGVRYPYLSSYLGIQYGEPYTQKKVDKIEQRLKQLPYIKLLAPPRLSFENNRARIYIVAGKQRANQFEGILALQNNPAGGVLLTGQVDLLLQNPFGSGKKLALNWQRLNTSSQQLNLTYRHPYILRSRVSAEGNFSLYRQQDSFLNRNINLALIIQQASGIEFSILARQLDSRLLDNATGPELASFKINLLGVGLALDRTDNIIFPTRGASVAFNFLAGPKTIRSLPEGTTQTEDITNQKFRYLYADAQASYYLRLASRTVLANSAAAGWLNSPYLFLPDLFRIGGLYSLRGFREQSVFTNTYGLVKTEMRRSLGRASYIFLFYDQAVTDQNWQGFSNRASWPLGIGAGLNLASEGGVFSLVYAIGKSGGEELSTQNSQIHFGYINRF